MNKEQRTENREKLTGNNFVLCSLFFVLFIALAVMDGGLE